MLKLAKKIMKPVLDQLNINYGDIHKNDRCGALYKAWAYVYSNHISGDYVEFGVYRGDSACSSLKALKKQMSWLRSEHNSEEPWRRQVAKDTPLNKVSAFHLLDTFAGMPLNNEGAPSFFRGNFYADISVARKKLEKINTCGIPINYYKGLFSDTRADFTKTISGRRIAIANIDCDLEGSTKEALHSINGNIDIGSIILFDDFYAFCADRKKGQMKAFYDYCEECQFVFEKFFDYQFVGQSFLVVDRKLTSNQN